MDNAREIFTLRFENAEMRSLLERIARNPENVSYSTLLRDNLHSWAAKNANAKTITEHKLKTP